MPLTTRTTYDAAGNVASTTDSVRCLDGTTVLEHLATTTFTHDALNRLVTSTVEDGVVWDSLHDGFATDGTLSVRVSRTSPGKGVVSDAVRIDRLGPQGEILETRIIDDDTSGADPRFTVGPAPYFESEGHAQTEYGGDLSYFTGATTATWTFTGLVAGAYRVSATWE